MADVFEYEAPGGTFAPVIPKLRIETPRLRLPAIYRTLLHLVKPVVRRFAEEVRRQLHLAIDWLFAHAIGPEDAKRLVDRLIDNAVDQV